MLGEVFGQRYRIVSRLGKGGMGVTYRAWDTIGGRPVVVKKPQRRFVDAPGFLDRFRREIDVLVKVPHPHIVPVLDVGQHEFLPFYVMRFLPGGSLADRRLRDAAGGPRPMRPSTLHLWIWQAAAALDHVHSAGVVHRDVKPANIFFDAGWHAFLGDFGVAKDLRALPGEDITGERDTPGTEKYMAPEQFDHAALVDGRADQYALAVVAYDLLAGRPPFVGDAAHVVVEITSHPAPPIERFRGDLPDSCRAGLMRALAKRPEDRFSTCTEFASALLGDVAPLSVEVGVARFLCPNCRTILRLPTTAGGEQGRCSRCHKGMMVAPDLSALWLLSETFATPPATEPEPTSTTVFGPDEPDPRRLPQDAVPTVTAPPATPPRIPPATAARAAAPARTVRRVRRRDWTLPLAGVALLVAIPTVIWPAARAWFDPVGAALATLETSPDDPLANGIVGRQLARDGDWGRALRHLEASQRPDYRAAARRELRARAAAAPDPGELLEVARAWWRFPGLGAVEPADRQAIERHAADTYLEAVDRLEDLGDIEDVNAWLDRDKRFRALVGDRRPAVPKAGGGPRPGKSAGR